MVAGVNEEVMSHQKVSAKNGVGDLGQNKREGNGEWRKGKGEFADFPSGDGSTVSGN